MQIKSISENRADIRNILYCTAHILQENGMCGVHVDEFVSIVPTFITIGQQKNETKIDRNYD